uniref:non-specific serine/threonine protein kinase n=1 Tax=Triticum urartu TaxID=4572 RepID=A0A8R7VB58_TRIUA
MLLSSGNLILTDSSNSAEVLWQSFDHPTDTLFPGAKLGWDQVTGLNRKLVSWKNLIGPATGVYCHRLDPSGVNQLLLTPLNSSIPYWSSGVWNNKYFLSIAEMTSSNQVSNTTFVHNDQEKYMVFNLVDESMVTHFAVDVSGRLKQSIWLESSQDWTMIYAQPKLQCDVYAICGPFTICNDNELPYCNCMEGFTITSPEDWELEDRTSGCSRITLLECISNKSTTHTTDKFYSVPYVELPQNAPKVEAPASPNECAQICLNNCSCMAYSFNDEKCSIWHNELLNIRELQCSGTTCSTGETLNLRVSAKDFHRLTNNRKEICYWSCNWCRHFCSRFMCTFSPGNDLEKQK